MSLHMVIPDAHAYPGDDFERFEMAGEFALKMRPDVIVAMGDWADMPSLCMYDYGKKVYEGRRYYKDCDASRTALDHFERPIREYNRGRGKNHKKGYRPRKVMLIGNHEHRIIKAIEGDSKLDGTISLDDLGYREYGWDVQPFLIPINIDGVYYNHYFVSGVMGNPISGENPSRSIVKKQMASCTAAHSHIMDAGNAAAPNGKMVYGLVGGCFFEHSMAFAEAVEHMYWRGVHLCHNVSDGEYDLDSWSMSRLRKEG